MRTSVQEIIVESHALQCAPSAVERTVVDALLALTRRYFEAPLGMLDAAPRTCEALPC
jgi:hypothetical protein